MNRAQNKHAQLFGRIQPRNSSVFNFQYTQAFLLCTDKSNSHIHFQSQYNTNNHGYPVSAYNLIQFNSSFHKTFPFQKITLTWKAPYNTFWQNSAYRFNKSISNPQSKFSLQTFISRIIACRSFHLLLDKTRYGTHLLVQSSIPVSRFSSACSGSARY